MAWSLTKHSRLIFLTTVTLLFKDSGGQQNGQLNQSNLSNPLGTSLQNEPNFQQNLNHNTKCPLHQKNLLNAQQTGKLPVNLQQKLLQQAAAQQQFILQQTTNLQNTNLQTSYPQGLNVQQQPLQQATSVQQPIQNFNFQQLHQHNLPQGNFQQLNQQQLNDFQHSNLSPTLASLQLANAPRSEMSFASPPLTNHQLSGLNPQMLQQMPDLGIIQNPTQPTSSCSSYPFNFHPNIETLTVGYPQNQQMPFANLPSPVIDISQSTNSIIPALSQISDYGNINNQQQHFAPVAVLLQNQQQNIPINSLQQMSGIPNQVTIIKSQQPQVSTGPFKRPQEFDQGQLSMLSSLLLEPQSSQVPSLAPALYGNPLLTALSNQGSKSSNLKTILPLLFNLLKERNTGCSCHNCGCRNNKKAEPQIFSGYANQNTYGYCGGKSQNNDKVVHEETNSSIIKDKENDKISADSGEYESDHEYFDSYEDEESKEEAS